ncbi:M949_RS01915 family surface polysaccharide biosynthesis protein [Olivibacter sitiensis]|uniref:M949_RS01915 family surface polysaccharide biosynthesis protein n=1 Tax=Olivibacter sitiensis TaxID=376470 RepID=UPI00048855D3|nr:hypothetical protein [Olivibacter sitiensis]
MKKLFCSAALAVFAAMDICHAQSVRMLESEELEEVLYGQEVDIPAFKGYEFTDRDGTWDVVLCERPYRVVEGDTLRNAIAAFCFVQDHGGYLKKWEFSDVLLGAGEEDSRERDLLFWTRYARFEDLDGDGLADPLLVYASLSGDGEEGNIARINIHLYHKQERITVQAVESVLDEGRSLRFSKGYTVLPPSIKQQLDELLEKIRKDRGVLLKDG